MKRHRNKKKISLFLDSGAFTAFTKNITIDIQEYIKFIKEHIQYIDVYVNLDVIGNAEATWENQQIMEKAGLWPLPVFHSMFEDMKWLKKYIDAGHDYVGIGGIAGTDFNTKQVVKRLDDCFEYMCPGPDHLPIVKVHGFGITSVPLMIRYPWYSVDSTSWVLSGRFGAVYVPKKKRGRYDFNEIPYKINVSDRSPSVKDAGKHISTFSEDERRAILSYFKEKGYELGESDKDGEIITPGLCNEYKLRDEMNIIYFLDLEDALPDWPWKFKLQKSRGLLR